jgi:aspartate-semialdehyde dehydrogenase
MNYNHKSIIQKINNNFLKISDRIISVPNFLITQLIMILIPIFISHKIKKITLFILQPFSNNNSKLFQSINERLGIFNVNNFFYSNTNSIMSNNVNKGENFKNEIKKIFDISDVVFDIRFIESSSLFSNSIFINIEFYEKFILSEIQDIFKNFSGIFIDNNFRNIFNFTCPSLFFSDLIFLQKIKKDTSNINSLNLSVSSNDLRNKPFFNIIQIFEHIYNCSFFI